MNKLIEYIAGAIRYASEETGLKDFSDFIIVLNDLEEEGKDYIMNMPVYVLPMRAMSYTFVLAYPWDIDCQRQRAMKAIIEYQELYDIEDIVTRPMEEGR